MKKNHGYKQLRWLLKTAKDLSSWIGYMLPNGDNVERVWAINVHYYQKYLKGKK